MGREDADGPEPRATLATRTGGYAAAGRRTCERRREHLSAALDARRCLAGESTACGGAPPQVRQVCMVGERSVACQRR